VRREDRPITEVPDVVGLGAQEACAIVRAAGLVPSGPDFAAEPSSGVVTAQRPIGTAGAEEGTVVFLWAQRGPGMAYDVLPPTPEGVGTLDPV
jgi:beta-lactam-binding protein with PASTA domain